MCRSIHVFLFVCWFADACLLFYVGFDRFLVVVCFCYECVLFVCVCVFLFLYACFCLNMRLLFYVALVVCIVGSCSACLGFTIFWFVRCCVCCVSCVWGVLAFYVDAVCVFIYVCSLVRVSRVFVLYFYMYVRGVSYVLICLFIKCVLLSSGLCWLMLCVLGLLLRFCFFVLKCVCGFVCVCLSVWGELNMRL